MKSNTVDKILGVATWFFALLTIAVLIFIIFFIIGKGALHIKLSLFSLEYNSENVSLVPALFSTVIITVISLIISAPLGIFASIYLVEYAKKGNRTVSIIRITTETLSGVPSIVYGLFGMLFFSTYLKLGFSILSGALTLSIMILPLIMRSCEEALIAVPDSYREGSFGLGAGKLRTIFKIVLPAAMNGILAGVILSIGRIVGETAALLYTAGTVVQIPTNIFQSARTLSIHMYQLSSEGFHTEESYATATILLLVVIIINLISTKIANKFGGK